MAQKIDYDDNVQAKLKTCQGVKSEKFQVFLISILIGTIFIENHTGVLGNWTEARKDLLMAQQIDHDDNVQATLKNIQGVKSKKF